MTVTTSDAAGAQAARPSTPRRKQRKRHAKSAAAVSSATWTACDQNISAKQPSTTCGFATNAFYEYWDASQAARITVWSPTAGRYFSTRCTNDGATVVCVTSDGGKARFPQSAVDSYTQSNADAYLAKAETGPEDAPTSGDGSGSNTSSDYDCSYSTPDPAPSYGGGGGGGGSDFCDTHNCIPNYPNGRGNTVQCADGTYSQSGGIQGACSHHGGVG